jgi:hypothetical protein
MMSKPFFDVMIDWKAPMLSPRQPRVVQLAAILDDADGRMVSTIDAIVDPMTSNWSEPVLDALINSDVSRIHGISYDIARTEGRHILDIVNEFATLVTEAVVTDPTSMLVAHNMAFDSRMMMAEMSNADLPPSLLNSLRPFCTMEAMTPIMKCRGSMAGSNGRSCSKPICIASAPASRTRTTPWPTPWPAGQSTIMAARWDGGSDGRDRSRSVVEFLSDRQTPERRNCVILRLEQTYLRDPAQRYVLAADRPSPTSGRVSVPTPDMCWSKPISNAPTPKSAHGTPIAPISNMHSHWRGHPQ